MTLLPFASPPAARDDPDDPPTGPYAQIILFGDSLTQQCSSPSLSFALQPALQDHYLRRLDVLNRGFSGYTSTQALAVLPQFMPAPAQAAVRILTVLLGANDACLPGAPSGQHVPLARYAANLRRIVAHPCVRAHAPRILLITPPPVDEYGLAEAGDGAAASRSAQHTAKYAEAARLVGEEGGVVVLDLWARFIAAAGGPDGDGLLPGDRRRPRVRELSRYFRDGLHFTGDGYRFMFENVRYAFDKAWPDLVAEVIPARFPPWGQAISDLHGQHTQ